MDYEHILNLINFAYNVMLRDGQQDKIPELLRAVANTMAGDENGIETIQVIFQNVPQELEEKECRKCQK